MNDDSQPSSHGLEPLLNINELADYLGVMFGVSDVRTWMEAMREPAGIATFPGGTESARG